MDVQTRLITPICPHYAEHACQKIMSRESFFAVKAGWPVTGGPDPTLRIANKYYLQDSIVLMRKLLQKEPSSKKPAPPTEENKTSIGLVYVNEHYSGWKEKAVQCLRVLQSKFRT